MIRFHKKAFAAFGVGVVLLATAGGAFAYWTQSGSGSATGTTGTTGTITLSGIVADGLFPGGSQPVRLTAANTGTSAVTVGTVHLVSVASSNVGCVVADFTMPDVAENYSVAAGATAQALPNTGILTMANTALNQDACKSAPITLTLTST